MLAILDAAVANPRFIFPAMLVICCCHQTVAPLKKKTFLEPRFPSHSLVSVPAGLNIERVLC